MEPETEQIRALEERIAEMPAIYARRRRLVARLKQRVGIARAARELGLTAARVYQIIGKADDSGDDSGDETV